MEMLRVGSLKPRNINRAFGICYKLSAKSGVKEKEDFIDTMRTAAEEYILGNQSTIFIPNLCDDRLLSHLYLYSEVASITDRNLNIDIANFAFKFLKTTSEAGKTICKENGYTFFALFIIFIQNFIYIQYTQLTRIVCYRKN